MIYEEKNQLIIILIALIVALVVNLAITINDRKTEPIEPINPVDSIFFREFGERSR